MEDLKQKIDALLQELSQALLQITTQEENLNPSDKKEQLKAIQLSIDTLSNAGTPVPDAIKKLKLDILNDINKIEEINKIKNEIREDFEKFLEDLISEDDDNSTHKKPGKRIYLNQLVESGLISPHTVISGRSKWETYKAKITEDGFILAEIKGHLVKFDNPTKAASEVIGRFRNGWTWWEFDKNGKTVTLDYIRSKYKENEA